MLYFFKEGDFVDKQNYFDVLRHQTQGIMFHSELITLFILLKNEKGKKYHMCQLQEETCNYFKTMNRYINLYGEIPKIYIKQEDISFIINDSISAPTTSAECQQWYEKAVNAWVEWEEETLELYQQMLDFDINDKFWKRMVCCVKSELEKARKIQSKYTLKTQTSTSTNQQSTVVSAQQPVVLTGLK